MSMESWKSSKFTFQSSVHSSHLLQSLNEQRKKDLLCDVTVVVENQSFRAHRAVLASCSDFFSARVSSLATPEGLVINLPVEVTAEGFEPLLEFAYTSKLTFSKENVLDLRNCTSVLGFKNLDKACFDFLLPKFFDSSRGTSNLQRKQCCKIKCCKARETGNDVIDENKAVPQPSLSQQKEQSLSSSTPTEDATGSQNVQSATDYSRLCPKYRKFQIACGKERQGLDVCGLETATVSKGPDDNCPSNCLPCSGNEDCSRSTIWDSGDLSKNQEMSSFDSCYTNTEACPPTQSTTSRSKDEMEVAKQLTDLPDIYSTQASPSGLGLRCQKTWHLDPKAEECLFMQSFGAKLHDVEVGATSHGSPYVPCNQSEDDSDSVDTEGDSESYSIEQLYKMALPLSVDQIVSLSRNDFQQMLKQQCLTREQLNAVHDIRRRSKNRIAARRCRKRKLDCINNLECEIQKLRSEHENLMAERIQLNQLKIKTWQSYSGLYERVCSEAALKPEQLQVLAKYSSPDCPLSAFLYSSTDLPQCPELQPQTSTSSCCFSTRTCCSEAKAPLASLIGKSDGIDQSSSKNLLPTRLAETQSHTCPADASCCSSLNLGTDLICQQERNK